MAARKPAKKKNASNDKKNGLGCLFWILFALIVSGLFIVNKPLIQRTLEETGFLDSLLRKTDTTQSSQSAPPVSQEPPLMQTIAPPVQTLAPRQTSEASQAPSLEPSPTTSSTRSTPPPSGPTEPPQQTTAVQTARRSVYFIRIDNDGTLSRIKIERATTASNTPLADAINILLQGPDKKETDKGLVSLIPTGTRLLSAQVRGNTAYLNFSEDFQFNSYGIEGYAAQLRQIIWTATEFSTVQDVQILIEGRRVDYLGMEGIYIGSPLSRSSM